MGKVRDLSNLQFDRLFVLGFYGLNEKRKSLWNCKCSCGNEIVVSGNHLTTGNTRSCGCLVDEARKNSNIDLTGETFGRWKVKSFNKKDKRGGSLWNCVCECGTEKIVPYSSLTTGQSYSCGCYRADRIRETTFIDLKGQTFGRLYVVSFYGRDEDGEALWNCLCSCKNYKIVKSSGLRSRNTLSCGCYNKERTRETLFINLIGYKTGKLKVIKYFGKTNSGGSLWVCLCECGNDTIVSGGSLTTKNPSGTKSCGCLKESWVANYLKIYYKEKFGAKTEYKIFRNPKTKNFLPFDIYIESKNIFIEIQGKQHFIYIPHFHRNIESFEYQKYKDKIKKKFAEKNGIFISIDLRKIKTTEQAIIYISQFL